MPKMARPPQPFIAPVSGDIDQKLAQIVAMINMLATTNVSPTFDHIVLTDPSGQSWAIYVQSNGSLRTELVTR